MRLKVFIPLVAWTTAASAQPVEHPASAPDQPAPAAVPAGALDLSVAVVADPAELNASDVRTALAGDLGFRIIDSDSGNGAIGRLTITLENQTLRVVYQAVDGRRIERSVAAPPLGADRVQLATFIASNLVRDQVSEILAGIPHPAVSINVPPPTPAVRTTAVPPPVYLAATVGLVPPLAVDRIAGSQVIVGFGLHGLVGVTDGSQVASISGLVDVQHQFARGLQVGGLGASAGRLDRGVQVGGLVASSSGRTEGIQVGGLGALSGGDTRGLQVGGIASVSGGDTRGIQVGGIGTTSRGNMRGIQVGGIATIGGGVVDGLQVGGVTTVARGNVQGAQVGGIATIARSMRGLQVGGITSIAKDVSGAQVAGIANVGNDVSGLQVGLVNVARRMNGVQVGLINVTEDGDNSIPIGLLNLARNGRVEVDGWVESTRFSAVGVRHGPRRVQNMIAIAWSPDHDHMLAGFGLGFHHRLAPGDDPITLDIDAVNWWTDLWHGELGQLEQLRATVAVPVGSIELIAGAAANVYISDGMDESDNFHPIAARRLTSNDMNVQVVTWPSVFAGVRLRAR